MRTLRAPSEREAEELRLTPSAAKRQLANVYRKIGVGPRARR
jgi:hypothetical protein